MNSKQIFFFTNGDSGMFLTVSFILPQNVALISLNFGSCLHSLFGDKKIIYQRKISGCCYKEIRLLTYTFSWLSL